MTVAGGTAAVFMPSSRTGGQQRGLLARLRGHEEAVDAAPMTVPWQGEVPRHDDRPQGVFTSRLPGTSAPRPR